MHSDSSRPRRKPGALATEILTVLTEAEAALTPGEVLERLPQDRKLSYSTVVTTLTRLHEKDAVTRERDGRAFRYSANGDPSTLVAWRMSRLLDAEADHASVLTRFVSDLSEKDEQTLRNLLAGEE
ncbi:BlaI/MecI/CopY family transcriptional regulator [Amycolatopsis acidicola]|uniref:BlaI/MecI/CopY family transcriptional regulator n=1 Tax=Amycolatopsis acidicola TaxID=2596893 RepID=A0A5N0VND8_9PSEU|nr:BlaI/MecI/CopY family transcriptional regulator [Amycolatopsis acidicola]KAA9166151.1 BlaI/MecI/CopY family transcriptional regulator [Amycolatopsis acidicola]